LGGEIRFVTIAVSDMANPDIAKSLAYSIARVGSRLGREVVLIATSEYEFYTSRDEAVKAINMIIKCIDSLDAKCFYDITKHYNIALCSQASLATAVIYAKNLGASKTDIISVKIRHIVSHNIYIPYISATIYR